MECKNSANLMMKFMDKTITNKEADKLKRHAAACPSCKADLEMYDEILSCFDDVEIFDAPHGFELCVLEKLQNIDIYTKKIAARVDSFMCVVLGVASVIVAVVFMLISNKAAILDYMSQTPSLAGIASFLRPLDALVQEYIANLGTAVDSVVHGSFVFLDTYKFIFLAAAAVLVGIRLYIGRKKKSGVNA